LLAASSVTYALSCGGDYYLGFEGASNAAFGSAASASSLRDGGRYARSRSAEYTSTT
jgi:hypothetical protein